MICHSELVVDASTDDVVDEVATFNDECPTRDGESALTAEVDVEIFEARRGPGESDDPAQAAGDRLDAGDVRGVLQELLEEAPLSLARGGAAGGQRLRMRPGQRPTLIW